MLVHTVFFWLKDGLDAQALAVFEQGLDALTNDPDVEAGYFGTPAATPPRDVVESSYSYGLVLVFADMAAHDRYQVGTVHHDFLAVNMPKWGKVVVHDVQTG